MFDLKNKTYLKILFFLSFITLTTAFAIQYLLGYQPCNLCIIERIPYALSIIILILIFTLKKDLLFYSILLLFIFTFSFLISIYHIGIEQGFLDESLVCGSKNSELLTKDEILKSFQKIEISCKDVAFKIFGLSLTTYNMILSIIMFLISLKIFLFSYGIKK